MTKIIIQGYGTVGKSTELFLRTVNPPLDIVLHDPSKGLTAETDDWTSADYAIVCVNTDINIALQENSIANVTDAIDCAWEFGFGGTTILRSTVGVSAINTLVAWLGDVLIVWPEYIREATWQTDSINPNFVILGGKRTPAFKDIIEQFTKTTIVTSPVEAMIAKLSTNTFLAMKVVFANQLYQLCERAGADYDIVSALLKNEGRLGDSHWQVPGPDGLRGFGGKCFPKDVLTFQTALSKVGISVDLIGAITTINDSLR